MTGRRRALGRGLDALLSQSEAKSPPPSAQPTSSEVPIEALEPNANQPRTDFDSKSLHELADSIREQGVLQPILATKLGGRSVIVAGERRWRAAKLAGLTTVPVRFRDFANEREMMEVALVENIQRADLSAIEEAEAFSKLQKEHGLSQEQIAQRVGKARATVTNSLRLLRLAPKVLERVRSGDLSAGQVRPLLSLPRREQERLASRAVRQELSARAIEGLVKQRRGEQPKKKAEVRLDVHTMKAIERLTRRLQTKVEIRPRRRGGVLQIIYHSEEELMRLYEQLLGRSE